MLRGFRSRRYAGDASVYGNAELRLTVAPFRILVPGSFGFFGLTDIGRVFYEADPVGADSWHQGVGGGIWLSFINRMQTLTVAVVNGDDMTGLYIRAGFMF
jgi:hemolysin activation/secretion protein